jgi:hypothetical protein
MMVVNKKVWTNVLKDAIKANFAINKEIDSLETDSPLEGNMDTGLAMYYYIIRRQLGDYEARLEAERVGMSEKRYNSLKERARRLCSDIMNTSSNRKTNGFKRYEVGKYNLIKNYFKFRGIDYEQIS